MADKIRVVVEHTWNKERRKLPETAHSCISWSRIAPCQRRIAPCRRVVGPNFKSCQPDGCFVLSEAYFGSVGVLQDYCRTSGSQRSGASVRIGDKQGPGPSPIRHAGQVSRESFGASSPCPTRAGDPWLRGPSSSRTTSAEPKPRGHEDRVPRTDPHDQKKRESAGRLQPILRSDRRCLEPADPRADREHRPWPVM